MDNEKKELINKILDHKLFLDGRGNLYGDLYKDYLDYNTGLWQHPDEFASLLLFLKEKNIKSFLNIGTFNGVTFNIMSDYLNKFNKVECITLDPHDHKPEKNINYSYVTTTSDSYRDQTFDLVFIDGHHGYQYVKNDYSNVGINAKYCVFHDIDDDFVRNDPNNEGGVPRFWNEIKQSKNYIEFVSEKQIKVMGIGILIQ